MAASLDHISQTLAQLAPLRLAESWDNVGLLAGDRSSQVQRVMTCLTLTPDVAQEAIAKQAQLVVAHHPLPFRPLKKLTSDDLTGATLWKLIGSGVAVYSAHTAYDSAANGINQQWAEFLELTQVSSITDPDDDNPLGAGRMGTIGAPESAGRLIEQCAQFVGSPSPAVVGPIESLINKVGFACGSGGSFVAQANRRGCQLLITGEATFHDCLLARSLGMTLGLLGHYHSERFAMVRLAEKLHEQHPDLDCWASEVETDPIVRLNL
jgi:dinuclear metal center YbgI/SA1388 family protein